MTAQEAGARRVGGESAGEPIAASFGVRSGARLRGERSERDGA